MASDDDTSVGGSSKHIVIPRWWDPAIWSWYNLKFDALALILIAFISCIFLVMIELEVDALFDWMPRMGCRHGRNNRTADFKQPKDGDVIAEEKRVAQMGDTTRHTLASSDGGDDKLNMIRVHNFTKEYDTFCGGEPVKAVEEPVSFAVDLGECFALLGVNGAGKSTTFKTLTRDVLPTTGDITIQGIDV